MSPTSDTRSARRRMMRRLLAEGVVTSQKQLAEALAEAGFAVTQATVSRDLVSLGAVRVKSDDKELHYEILDDRFAFRQGAESAARAMSEFTQSIAASGNLVVVHTAPGAAHLVASALDGAGLPDVIGTVAGDDTIMVIAAEGVSGASLVELLQSMGAS